MSLTCAVRKLSSAVAFSRTAASHSKYATPLEKTATRVTGSSTRSEARALLAIAHAANIRGNRSIFLPIGGPRDGGPLQDRSRRIRKASSGARHLRTLHVTGQLGQ